MAMFRKKDKYVDLTERMKKQEERLENFKSNMGEGTSSNSQSQENSGGGFFSFFGGSNSSSSNTPKSSSAESLEEKKRKLAKRLTDMTTKMEDLENQIYHLKQKVEVLERKQKIGY